MHGEDGDTADVDIVGGVGGAGAGPLGALPHAHKIIRGVAQGRGVAAELVEVGEEFGEEADVAKATKALLRT